MPDFYRLNPSEVLKQLNTDCDVGLSTNEVAARQVQYGKNVLPVGEGTSLIKLILGQFTDLMVIILLAAALISAYLGDIKDVIVIMTIVVLNALLGTYQEFRAEKALAALSALQVPLVRVRRNGNIHQISAEELVPGDIILLEEGDRIPADGRLTESYSLQVEEAALTGESHPVEKHTQAIPGDAPVPLGDRNNMVFMGTAVNYGRGQMVVTETGLKTEIGHIAALLLQVEQGVTPLQRRMNQLGRTLAIGAGIIVTIVFLVGYFVRGIPPADMFLTAVSLAVAAVPEGLPALITIGLSLGAARMVRRNALIRRLPAVETLGSVTIICSDKTGTLTKNEMTATLMALPGHGNVTVTGIGYTPKGEFQFEGGEILDPKQDPPVKRFLEAMALSTNAHLEGDGSNGSMSIVGDTTEGALLVAAAKVGWKREELEKGLPRVAELPFSSERKAMTTIHSLSDTEARELFGSTKYISITKGAPDRLIEWATHERAPEGSRPLTPERRKMWGEQVNKMAARGLRVLGIAYRPLDQVPDEIKPDVERELHLLGLVGILDPARPEARQAVKTARTAGIRSIMITGDHALTAETIARDLGIITDQQKAVTGTELDEMSEDELARALDKTSCFARVSPEHKLKIVRVLQKQNQIVAMTGDGVNDAPALKQADIGVAMGITGTDVSKGAAAMVLTDDNFASIVAAVEEGRVIYDNIRKFVKYLLSSNIGEILVMFLSLLIGLKIPLLAIQILWINLVTDGLPAIALGFEPAEVGVMQRPPRSPKESIFAGGMGRHITWVAILLTTVTLVSYLFGYVAYGMNPFSKTLGLEKMSETQLRDLMRLDPTHEDLIFKDLNWDQLTEEQRSAELLRHENDEAQVEAEKASGGIIGELERIPRTIGFTVLALGQIFHVSAIHGGDRESFFKILFRKNMLLFYAALSTFVLQLAVIYIPFLQTTFETVTLNLGELALALLLASTIMFAVEIEKFFRRQDDHRAALVAAA